MAGQGVFHRPIQTSWLALVLAVLPLHWRLQAEPLAPAPASAAASARQPQAVAVSPVVSAPGLPVSPFADVGFCPVGVLSSCAAGVLATVASRSAAVLPAPVIALSPPESAAAVQRGAITSEAVGRQYFAAGLLAASGAAAVGAGGLAQSSPGAAAAMRSAFGSLGQAAGQRNRTPRAPGARVGGACQCVGTHGMTGFGRALCDDCAMRAHALCHSALPTAAGVMALPEPFAGADRGAITAEALGRLYLPEWCLPDVGVVLVSADASAALDGYVIDHLGGR